MFLVCYEFELDCDDVIIVSLCGQTHPGRFARYAGVDSNSLLHRKLALPGHLLLLHYPRLDEEQKPGHEVEEGRHEGQTERPEIEPKF